MTIINFALLKERALFGTDSLSFVQGDVIVGADGSPVHDTKLVALPHARLVLGVLGSVKLRRFLHSQSHEFADIDTAIERIPALLKGRPEFAGHESGSKLFSGHQAVVAVGWSPRVQRVVGAEFHSERDYFPRSFKHYGDSFCYINPPVDSFKEPVAYPETIERMEGLLRRQIRELRERDAGTPVGGVAQFAEITEHGISMSRGGDLGMPNGSVVCVSETDMASASLLSFGAAAEVYETTDANTYTIGGSPDPGANVSFSLAGDEGGVLVSADMTFKVAGVTSASRYFIGTLYAKVNGTDYGGRAVEVEVLAPSGTTAQGETRPITTQHLFVGLPAGNYTAGSHFALNSQAGVINSDAISQIRTRVEVVKR